MEITANNNLLTVNGYSMKVYESSEYVYKLTKRCIYAHGGAVGLVKWMNKCFAEEYCECLAKKVANWVIQNGK